MKKFFKEDGEAVPVNNAGSGNIDGIGAGPKGEPGFPNMKKKKRLKDVVLKRSPPKC
ncbi:MAG: hypothetical protein P4L79_10735 [Legionella sp.]|uniref:hypothetical protein n=1 Tax=Legionella sp. TaxID=459 RepID=UPI0028441D94|nr:hypothetical protein [Legionella sp.]